MKKCLILISFIPTLNSLIGQNLLRNGNFESYSTCPNDQNNPTGLAGVPIPFVTDWFSPNIASADYCNRCGFDSQYPVDFDPPATDLNGGTGYLGIINNGTGVSEQAAQCLSSTILAGSACTFTVNVNTAVQRLIYPDFSPYPSPEPIQIGIWGASTCPAIEYTGSADCPTAGGKTLLGTSTVINLTNGSATWASRTITFTAPFNIQAVSIGGICKSSGTFTEPQNYYYIDELSLTAVSPCPSAPTGTGGNASVCGSNPFTFPSRTCATGTLRWYENATPTGPFYTSATVVPTTTTTYYPFCYTTCLSPVGTSVTATHSCPVSGSGTVWTWTGCNSSDWFNPCNWDRGSTPNTTSNVIIPFTTNQPIISGGAANCYDITIQTSTGAVLNLNSTSGGSINIVKP